MSHTKGKLETGSIHAWELWIGADFHIADVHGSAPIRHDNAERLVKCWNILEQFPTELLDEIAKDKSRLLLTERGPHDALLEACKELLRAVGDELGACSLEEVNEHPTLKAHSEIYDRAEAAIAAAKPPD